MGEAWEKLRKLDAFGKVNEDFFTRTLSGGVITLVSSIIMAILFFSELRLFLTVRTDSHLSVDTSRGEKLQINLDVTFPRMPCGWLSLDVMDVSGELELDVDHDIFRKRLSGDGTPLDDGEKHEVGSKQALEPPAAGNGTVYCGSCYGAQQDEHQCCNTCDEVREAYRRRGWGFNNPQGIAQCEKEGFLTKIKEQQGEGCHVWGTLLVNKVAGNFHFAPGKSFQHGNMHVHDLVPFPTKNFDMSHHISKLSFGKDYPGRKNPLDGVRKMQVIRENPGGGTGMFQYFLKAVPTTYINVRNSTIPTYQYSVTEYFKHSDLASGQNLPGVFMFIEPSPVQVRLTERRSSFAEFLTSACAIVGGVFTVSGLIDATLYHTSQAIRKKIDLGKLA